MKTFKKLLSLLFVTVLLFSLCVPALAADGNVSYVGGSEKFFFTPGSRFSPTDIFPDIKGVMPGDSVTQKILVRNDLSNGTKIRLYIRALGAQLDTDDFLSQLTLTVKQNGTTKLFEAPADETAQLTDWVCLGTLYAGGQMTLDVTLDVPITMGNEFQEQVGYLDWEFKAEEIPTSPDDPPPTGDESNLVLWVSLMTVCSAALIFILFGRKKQHKH